MIQNLELIWAKQDQMNISQKLQEHSHNCFQLYYVNSGSPVFLIGGTAVLLKEGMLLLIPPGVVHSIPALNEAFFYSEYKIVAHEPFLIGHLTKSYYIGHAFSDSVFRYLTQNWNNTDAQNQLNIDRLLSSLFLQFFLDDLCYEEKKSRYITDSGYTSLTRRMLIYIENCFSQKFSLEKMGAELHYNSNYLSTSFTKDTGHSIIDYLNLLRVRQAIIFFAYYGQDVFSARESAGFSNPSYFSRTFKSLVGTSPNRVRKAFSPEKAEETEKAFTAEPILNYRLCSMDEALLSLKRIGQLTETILNTKPAENSSAG